MPSRPDLVTLPLPSFSGSAAVPSTVDVYVNNVRTISQDVDGGPFRLTNLPILSGQGNASIIVRDSSGRDVETTLPFLVSNKLLRGGLFDFSAEAGVPRLFYGARSNDLCRRARRIRESALRLFRSPHPGGPRGSNQWPCQWRHRREPRHRRAGVFSAAFAGSRHGGSVGRASLRRLRHEPFRPFVLGFDAADPWRLRRPRIGDREAIRVRSCGGRFRPPPSRRAGFSKIRSGRCGRQKSRINSRLACLFPLLGGSINFGYVHQEDPFGNRTKLLNVSYSRQLFDRASFFATAFAGLGDRRNAGISLGLSIPLGGDVTASSGASRDRSGLTVASDVTKPLREEPGSYGWRLSDLEGEQRLRLASAAYRGDHGKVEATAIQSQSGFAGTISQEGAIVAAGGGVFFANRIDDAFAIVDAGAPGIEVSYENRPVARTDGERQGDRAFAERLPAQQDFHRSARFAAQRIDRHDAGRAGAGRPQRRLCRFRNQDRCPLGRRDF